MIPFLRLTAENLYKKYGDNLAEIAVIFPNNRAKLFFCEHLFQITGKPVWTPSFLSISDLYREQSSLQTADQLTLVAQLYKVYIQESDKDEPFDEFYLWGELLLSDFDDVDKNMADAGQLFRNIREQAAYTDTLEHLTEEQVEAIRHFFKNFDPDKKTELKQRFIENWNILLQVYNSFREKLTEKNIAYEGMLYRNVIEKLKNEGTADFHFKKYAFVGFNVLNGCEISLFKILHKAGKALFYWDYDESYIHRPEHEAGRFMRQNLEKFPNELDKTYFDSFSKKPKKINFIASSTENAEARYLPYWISSLQDSEGQNIFHPEETAIILCNENLLLPVLHSVPDSVKELNVTMSFPLNQTPVCNLITRICQLHTNGYLQDGTERFNYRYVLPVLQQPLVKQVSAQAEFLEKHIRSNNIFRPNASDLQADAFLKAVFTPVSDALSLSRLLMDVLTLLAQYPILQEDQENEEQPAKSDDNEDPLFQESVYRCYTLASKLYDLINNNLVEVRLPVFQSLLQKIMSVTGIPFSGEPVRGMQIMGMLETRNLDFRNLLILSVNEGMLPRKGGDLSFIPYNLRKGFGLTTSEHKDSIFSYYFFRLLQRAENVTLIYNTSTDGVNPGEMSRFMLQLLVDSPFPIGHFNLSSGMGLTSRREIMVEKTPEIMEVLKSRYDASHNPDAKTLSPTALNSLIDCSLKFYFRYVAGLKEKDEISDDIDGAVLGTFFHHSAEYIYSDILLRKAGLESGPAIIEKARQESTILKGLKDKSLSGMINTEDIEPWLKGIYSIEKVADHVFRTDFFKLPADSASTLEYNGEQLIKHKLLTGFLSTLLRYDSANVPFEIKGLEEVVNETIEVPTPKGLFKFRIGGIIDRMDIKEGTLRIIDYKTGGDPVSPESVEVLFTPKEKRGNYVFQIFLYSSIMQKEHQGQTIEPLLLYINKAGSKDFNPHIRIGYSKSKSEITEFQPFESEFREYLIKLVSNLFDVGTPFKQTEIQTFCQFCGYKSLCRR